MLLQTLRIHLRYSRSKAGSHNHLLIFVRAGQPNTRWNAYARETPMSQQPIHSAVARFRC